MKDTVNGLTHRYSTYRHTSTDICGKYKSHNALRFFFPCLRYNSVFSAVSNATYPRSHPVPIGTEKHNGGKDPETTNGKRSEYY